MVKGSSSVPGVQGEAICLIPARGGSQRIHRKNLSLLGGKPLIVHTIEHALGTKRVDAVYVSTEDSEIASVSSSNGAHVIERPPELATDTASSESVLLHALDRLRDSRGRDPELVVFLQCTSPIRREGDIDGAIQKLIDEQADSLLSVTQDQEFLWHCSLDAWEPINYDYRHRPREQDFHVQFRENGSMYLFKPWVLRKLNCRLGGRIAVYEMDYWSSFQIDRPEDLRLCEWILRNHQVT